MKIVFPLFLLVLVMQVSCGQIAYEKSAGIKLGYGLGITGKYAMYNDDAIEVIINIDNESERQFDYTSIRFTGLYEIYNDLSYVTDGLTWYFGAGPHLGFLGGDYEDVDSDFASLYLGLTLVGGLDYSFRDTPINLSLDWTPRINILGGQPLFDSAGGFLSVRYILE
jgi:hypothetical protein